MLALIKYYLNVLTHKYYVLIECFKRGLYIQGIVHDLSKLGLKETKAYYILFEKYPNPNKLTYESIGERLSTYEIREIYYAHNSHLHNNKHHWQYWIYIDDSGKITPLEMPKKYELEMICDWCARSKQKNNNIKDWYNKTKGKMIFHPMTDINIRIKIELL